MAVRTKFNLGKVQKAANRHIVRNMNQVVFLGQGEVAKSIKRGDPKGIVYRRGNVDHRASAPGQPPAADTGRLDNSIQSDVSSSPREVVGTIFTNVEYALALELPNPEGLNRPYLRPFILNNKALILKMLSRP